MLAMMKLVILLFKNFKIGCEHAAKNLEFIFSLIESYKLSDMNLQDYLKYLFV